MGMMSLRAGLLWPEPEGGDGVGEGVRDLIGYVFLGGLREKKFGRLCNQTGCSIYT